MSNIPEILMRVRPIATHPSAENMLIHDCALGQISMQDVADLCAAVDQLRDALNAQALELHNIQASMAQMTHRHVKRGTLYRLIGKGRAQTDTPLEDYAEVAIYRGAEGDLWARPVTEFEDGRFEAVRTGGGRAAL